MENSKSILGLGGNISPNAWRISEVRQENIEKKLLTSAYLSYTRL